MKRILSQVVVTIVFSLAFFVFFAFFASGCGYDDFDDWKLPEAPAAAPSIAIGDLREIYTGHTVQITENMIIGGYVSANDKSENLYQSFILEDGTGAVEVFAGLFDTHHFAPRDRYINIFLNGCYLGSRDGVLQLGLQPTAGLGTSALPSSFGHRAILAEHMRITGLRQPVEPARVAIASLSEDMCGRLVTIAGVRFVEPEHGLEEELIPVYGEYSWASPSKENGFRDMVGYRIFRDAAGDEIAVFTSNYANFAWDNIPVMPVALTGILSYGKTNTGRTMYLLRLRELDDVWY